MTNFERWRDKLKTMVEESEQIAIVNGELAYCNDFVGCDGCMLCGGFKGDILKYTEWLLDEYKEEQKLTKQEKAFCDYIETGYLVREHTRVGELTWFYVKPEKVDGMWKAMTPPHSVPLGGEIFHFIKPTDTEPYSIEDMSEWEVEKD